MSKIKKITDKARLDWLQKGHEVIALVSSSGSGMVFCSNFSDQEWKEFKSVREAIDFAINSSTIKKNK